MTQKNTLFIFFSFSFLFGVFLNNYLESFRLSFIILLFGGVFLLNFFLWKKQFLGIILILIFGLGLGIGRSYFYNLETLSNSTQLEPFLESKRYTIISKIDSLYQVKPYSKQYLVEIQSVNNTQLKSDVLAIVQVPSNFNPENGAIISGQSKLYKIKNFAGFDYRNYLLSKKIYTKIFFSSFKKVGHESPGFIRVGLKNIRDTLMKNIKKIYPKEEGIFLGGILLGARENLPQKLKTNFNNSGLTHFIAVSGFNITILVIFLSYIFSYFPLFLRVTLTTLSIVGFTILVGDTAPVVRAAIMGLIGYYALAFGRTGDSLAIIMVTAVIMVVISPLSINYDVSFHLSFLAVVGIIYTQGFFKKIFYFLPKTLAIQEAFVLTLASLSFTLPVMIFNFGQISLFAPLANILVTWTIPIAMLLGFISILVYFYSPFIGIIIGYFDWVFLRYDIAIVHFFGELEFAILRYDFGALKNYLEILYFIILVFIILYFNGKKK